MPYCPATANMVGNIFVDLEKIYKKRKAEKQANGTASVSTYSPYKPSSNQDQFVRSARLSETQHGNGTLVRFGSGNGGNKLWDFFTKTQRERDYDQAHKDWKAVKYNPSASRTAKEKALYQKERLKEKSEQSKKWQTGTSGLVGGAAPFIATHVITGDPDTATTAGTIGSTLAIPFTTLAISAAENVRKAAYTSPPKRHLQQKVNQKLDRLYKK